MPDIEILLPVLVVGGIVLLIVVAILGNMQYEKQRREGIQKVADELGLPFFPNGDPTLIAQLGMFNLFSQGRSRKIFNMLHGDTEEIGLGIFDYQFTTGSGKNSNTWKQTVVYFNSPNLNLPQFAMRPQSFFHKIGKMFGYQDIDFDTHPVFSQNFILQGANEASVRALFTPELLTFFEGKTGISLEGQGAHLVFFRHNSRTKPDQLRDLMNEGFTVFKHLSSAEPPA
ncbi:MAG: hypothetical protein RIC55_09790 [Pirellulaceae bacterium]